jgi:hypothetical protein
LSKHKDEVKETGKKGRKYCKEYFTFKITAESLEDWVQNPFFAPDKFKKKRIFYEKEEALKNCYNIIENQKSMIIDKDNRIAELENIASKNIFYKLYGYFKILRRKLRIK